jgi:hypothetical protein
MPAHGSSQGHSQLGGEEGLLGGQGALGRWMTGASLGVRIRKWVLLVLVRWWMLVLLVLVILCISSSNKRATCILLRFDCSNQALHSSH